MVVGLDVGILDGRELVGIEVGDRVVGLEVEGPLVGLLEFLVGIEVVGLIVCSAVGAAVGPVVLG